MLQGKYFSTYGRRGAWTLYENAKLKMKINLNKLINVRSCDGISRVWK